MKTLILTTILLVLPWTVSAEFTAADSAAIVAMFHDPVREARGWGEIFHTNHVEIFHGPTASSVKDYVEKWAEKGGHEILNSDLFIYHNMFTDSIANGVLDSKIIYYLTVTYRREDVLWQNGDITHR